MAAASALKVDVSCAVCVCGGEMLTCVQRRRGFDFIEAAHAFVKGANVRLR